MDMKFRMMHVAITMHNAAYHIIKDLKPHKPSRPRPPLHPPPASAPLVSSLPSPTKHAPSTVVSHSSTRALSRARSRSRRIAFARCSTSLRVSRLVPAGFDALVSASNELSALSCEDAEGACGERDVENPVTSDGTRLGGRDGLAGGSVGARMTAGGRDALLEDSAEIPLDNHCSCSGAGV